MDALVGMPDPQRGASDARSRTSLDGDRSPEATSTQQRVVVRCVRTMEDFQQALAIRAAAYLGDNGEQYHEEFDRNDFAGTPILASVDGHPVGAMRVRYFKDFAKVEHMAIHPRARSLELLHAIVDFAFAMCRKKGYRTLYGHAEERFVSLWEEFGLVRIGTPAFAYSAFRYYELKADLEPHPSPFRFEDNALLLARPEGEWDALGPLERECISLGAATETVAAPPPASAKPPLPLPPVTIRVVGDMNELQQALFVRAVAERDYGRALYGDDLSGGIVLAARSGEPLGTIRIRYFAEFARLDGLAVAPHLGSTELARVLVGYAVTLCRRKGYRKIRAFGRAADFAEWRAAGFTVREVFRSTASEERYVDLSCECPAHPEGLALGSDPVAFQRPEGDWFRWER